MKKNISIYITILLLIMSTTMMSCSLNDKIDDKMNNKVNDKMNDKVNDKGQEFEGYDSYICDMTNDGIIKDVEKDWWMLRIKHDSSVEKEKKVTFQGVSYNCSYIYSTIGAYHPFFRDVYEDEDKDVDISIDSSSGEIVGYHRKGLSSTEYYLKPEIYVTAESALPMAKEIASQYININDYTIVTTVHDMTQSDTQKLKEYTFEFIKCISGYFTSERIYIAITSKGDFRTISVDNIGLFKDKQISINKEMLDQSIDVKLNAIYSDKYEYTYNIDKQVITYSPEGDLVICSQVEVSLVGLYSTGVVLVTIID